MGEVISIVLVALMLLTIFCMYKMLDKIGLYFAIVLVSLISFVLTFKVAYIFKINVNIGIIPLISVFTILYMFLAKNPKTNMKNLVLITLFSNISVACLLAIMNYYIPAVTETISINMQGTFEYNYKILIFYPIIITLSEFLTIKLFRLLLEIQNNISIAIALTYVITGLIYTVIFYIIIYHDILKINYTLFLGVSTYIFGIPIAVINALYINYLLKKKVIS